MSPYSRSISRNGLPVDWTARVSDPCQNTPSDASPPRLDGTISAGFDVTREASPERKRLRPVSGSITAAAISRPSPGVPGRRTSQAAR